MSLYWPCTAALLVMFCWVLVARLRASHFRRPEAAGLALLALLQPAYFCDGALRAGFVAMAAYAIAASTQDLVERQDPRRIVFFGSSLAGAQLVAPLWGITASVLLPLVIRRTLPAFEPARIAGFFMSLFFIPAIMTLTLAGLYLTGHENIARWPTHMRLPTLESGGRILGIATIAVPLFAATWRTANVPNLVAICVCAVMAGTTIVAELLGFGSSTSRLQFGAAAAALMIVVVSGWELPWRRGRLAVAALGFIWAVCWLLRTIELRAANG